jgi:hypothetical protein
MYLFWPASVMLVVGWHGTFLSRSLDSPLATHVKVTHCYRNGEALLVRPIAANAWTTSTNARGKSFHDHESSFEKSLSRKLALSFSPFRVSLALAALTFITPWSARQAGY